MAGRGPLRVLVVGKQEGELSLDGRYLHAQSGEYELAAAADTAEALARIESGGTDCVLIHHAPPAVDARELLQGLAGPDGRARVAVIVLQPQDDAVVAVEVMRAGAHDYAARARLTPEGLARSVRNAVEKVALQREIEHRERALEASQRQQLEMRDQLISHVSHELRTPLTAIHQFVTILLDGVAGALSAQQLEYLGIVLRNARALRDMIDDLMEASRCETGKLAIEPRVIRPESVVLESVTSLRASANEKRLGLHAECAVELPNVLADPVRVAQIVRNLLDNAIKFTPAGKGIHVRVQRSERGPGLVEVSVQDEGCGIRPERIPLLFQRLHQEPDAEFGSRRGLGLGLYICRELVTGQGGELWAESEPGRGSRFAFTLPVFSLESFLRSSFADAAVVPAALFLVSVRVRERAGSGDEAVQRARVYAGLQRIVYSPSDRVLPRFEAGAAQDEFYVVAAADEPAGEAMVRRLQRSLGPAVELAPGAALEIGGEPLPPARAGERDVAELAAQILARISPVPLAAGAAGGSRSGSA